MLRMAVIIEPLNEREKRVREITWLSRS